MPHRSLLAIPAAALVGALAACGAAAPPTPGVRIVVPPTRTPPPTPPPLADAETASLLAPTPAPASTSSPLPPATVTATAAAARLAAPAVAVAPTLAPTLAAAAKTPALRAAACVSVSFDDLRRKGPRPAALDALADGGCVNLRFASGEETRYVWHPAGARFAPGSSMYVRWKDGLVAVYKKDGVLKTNEYYRGRQQELALAREDGKYKLPASGSFVFSIADNDNVIGLVDTLVKGSNR